MVMLVVAVAAVVVVIVVAFDSERISVFVIKSAATLVGLQRKTTLHHML